MERDEPITLSPFDFPDVGGPESASKPRFDTRVAMIAAAHEQAAILRFLAEKAQDELLAPDDAQLPRHVIKLGPGRGRRASSGAVSGVISKLVAEADEWDRIGREIFRRLPKRVAERLTLPDQERGLATVLRIARS